MEANNIYLLIIKYNVMSEFMSKYPSCYFLSLINSTGYNFLFFYWWFWLALWKPQSMISLRLPFFCGFSFVELEYILVLTQINFATAYRHILSHSSCLVSDFTSSYPFRRCPHQFVSVEAGNNFSTTQYLFFSRKKIY